MLTRALIAVRTRFHPLHRMRRSPLLAALLRRLDVPVSRRLRGIDWPVRLRAVRHASMLLDSRISEPGVYALFVALARRHAPLSFWDVGANVGFYSLLVLSRDKTARAAMFEPDPENCALIRRTIAEGRIDRAQLIEAAASDAAGEADFFADRVSGLTGSLAPAEDAFVRRNYGVVPARLTVRTVRLDSLLADGTLAPPNLIKIDVEGAEAEVFAGARETVARHRPFIVFESFAEPAGGLCRALEEEGYLVVSAEGPDAALVDGANFLAVPPAHRNAFAALREDWRAELKRYA